MPVGHLQPLGKPGLSGSGSNDHHSNSTAGIAQPRSSHRRESPPSASLTGPRSHKEDYVSHGKKINIDSPLPADPTLQFALQSHYRFSAISVVSIIWQEHCLQPFSEWHHGQHIFKLCFKAYFLLSLFTKTNFLHLSHLQKPCGRKEEIKYSLWRQTKQKWICRNVGTRYPEMCQDHCSCVISSIFNTFRSYLRSIYFL